MGLVLRGALGALLIDHALEPGIHTIGRGAQAAIKLPDASVSRDHASIEVDSGQVIVRDLGSRNGTWVNGLRLGANEPLPLRDGDELRFGAVNLRAIDPTRGGASGNDSSMPSVIPRLSTGGLEASVRLSWDELRSQVDPSALRERDLFHVISEAGSLLVAPLPLEEIFESALGLVARLVPARRILILLNQPDETGQEIPVVRAARPSGTAGQRIMLSQTLLQTVLEKREALLVADARLDPALRDQASIVLQDISSALAAPLFDNERVIGLVYADTNDIFQRFDQDMLRAFTLVANLIAVKITNTRLLEAEREKDRMAQELATASRIQRGLLPTNLPEFAGYELYAHQEPCFECAGDLYDAAIAGGQLDFALGDVSGKGMGAAMLMSHVMACLRIYYDEQLPPLELVERLHRQIFHASRPSDFVTLFYGRLDPASHRVDFVNAGHCPALLFHADGSLEELETTGLPVGMMLGPKYEASSTQLRPGDLLLIYSDGIPEAFKGEDDYGEDRLKESVRSRLGASLEEITQGALLDLRSFLEGTPPGDDITLFLLRRAP